MQIFGWMQKKLSGSKKRNPISVNHYTRKEEFSDWPHGLLAIGTFGNNAAKEEDSKSNFVQENQPHDNLEQLTPEEVQSLQNELNLILHKQDGSTCDTGSDNNNKNNNELVNGNPSLEDDQDCRSDRVVLGRGKEICVDHTINAINKRSLSFLLKKMFVCRGGFTPTPSLRDQVPECRMEKILRAILHKKIYPQNPSSTSSRKKYLENKLEAVSDSEDEMNENDDNKSKWVKTDSEYIVLEI
ncbi:protein DEEPER ROOTING 1 isoform X2 [Ricinus communis]|uniref:protein DEEPER ROOTING 1 isoform X2 n=1 Tax=Ricinus communis TaxID=3988 RepID=UPI000772A423|nr:protein DEEPER ROOTING 1 isoform X2 [Ricinus communis]|eukprot:XP_015572933.1 uncharacterized protein LOC8281151 isoform X1 [Ricinus communis]